MTQEKAGDEVKEPEAKVEEPKVEEAKPLSPQEELDALRQQLGDLQKQLTASQEEAKSHQRTVGKKDQELQEVKQFQSEIRERLDTTEAMIAALGDKTLGGGGETGQSFAQQVQASQLQRQRVALANKQDEVIRERDELLKDTGLDKDSPQLKAAGLLFSMGTQTGNIRYLEDSIKEVREVVAKHKPEDKTKEGKDKKVETEEEKVDRLAEEKKKAWLVEKGYVTPEGAEPSAGGGQTFTREQIKNMPPEEYEKLQPEINKARKEGRIK